MTAAPYTAEERRVCIYVVLMLSHKHPHATRGGVDSSAEATHTKEKKNKKNKGWGIANEAGLRPKPNQKLHLSHTLHPKSKRKNTISLAPFPPTPRAPLPRKSPQNLM